MNYTINENDQELKIIMTDLQLHIQKPVNPKPWHRVAERVAISGKPARAYTTNVTHNKDGTLIFVFPDRVKKIIKNAENAGKKIRYFMPKQGLYVYAGKDLLEYIDARERKVDSRVDSWRAED